MASSNKSAIAEFYKNQNIFITGATGFVGKVLLEKLLRSCPDIDKIFVLMREKKNMKPQDRLEKLFTDSAFDALDCKHKEKVIPILGDISIPSLGLSNESRKLLIDNVNIIFHSAASINFNLSLRETLILNLRGTRDLLTLSKEMKNLKSFCYVSTAYSHSNRSEIDEVVYPTHITPQEILHLVNTNTDIEMEQMAKKLLGSWPNYYTFSKALAENMIKENQDNLPLLILRPSTIIGSYEEPSRGWIDSNTGINGMVCGMMLGLVKIIHGDRSKYADIIPVDYVANSIIACTWDFTTNTQNKLKIYNCVCGNRNPILWGDVQDSVGINSISAPTYKSCWYFSVITLKTMFLYHIAVFFLQTIPGAFVDLFSLIRGRQRRMMKAYRNIDSFNILASYFCIYDFKFKDSNIQSILNKMNKVDQNKFKFNVENIDWNEYLKIYYLGIRKHIIKDDPSTIQAAITRNNRLYYLHRLTQLAISIFLLRFVMYLYSWVPISIFNI